MKCKIFWGCATDVKERFDRWAKGKDLTREIIIHEHIYPCLPPEPAVMILIFVYHPDSAAWDVTKSEPIQPILTKTTESPRMEREVIAQ